MKLSLDWDSIDGRRSNNEDFHILHVELLINTWNCRLDLMNPRNYLVLALGEDFKENIFNWGGS